MRIAAAMLSVLFALMPLGCSEISGLELVVVGEVPSDIDSAIRGAAVAAGFVGADLSNPLEVQNAGAHFFELPRADLGDKVTIQTGSSSGNFHIRIGRSIYSAYTVSETAAASKFVAKLREGGVVMRKTWSNKLALSKDLELWLRGNRANES